MLRKDGGVIYDAASPIMRICDRLVNPHPKPGGFPRKEGGASDTIPLPLFTGGLKFTNSLINLTAFATAPFYEYLSFKGRGEVL